uniref:Uncharacterized protein n=1 Tax=Rhizophora mucronata TaxID=61149 RepID=A0A2P2NRK2_RHIMU
MLEGNNISTVWKENVDTREEITLKVHR